MKKIILSLLVLFSFSIVHAQISDDQYKSLIPYIKAEDWKTAYNSSSKMLKNMGDDNSDNVCLVRFVNIYAAAGLVKIEKMKFNKLQKIAAQFHGKNILSADFLGSMNPQNTLNKTFFSNFDGENKGFTTVSNKFGKIIFYMEFDFADKIDPRALHGKMQSCGGVIREIEVNPESKTDWILKLKVSKAFIKK